MKTHIAERSGREGRNLNSLTWCRCPDLIQRALISLHVEIYPNEVEREGWFREGVWRGLERAGIFLLARAALKVQSFRLLCIVYCFCGRGKTPGQSSLKKEGGLLWLTV